MKEKKNSNREKQGCADGAGEFAETRFFDLYRTPRYRRYNFYSGGFPR